MSGAWMFLPLRQLISRQAPQGPPPWLTQTLANASTGTIDITTAVAPSESPDLTVTTPTLEISTRSATFDDPSALTSDGSQPPTTVEGADVLTADGPEAIPTQASNPDGFANVPDESPSKGLSFEAKLGLGLGLGLGIPIVLALLAFLIVYVRRRRRLSTNQSQAALLQHPGSVRKVQSELFMVETPRAQASSVVPRSADGLDYEHVPVPLVGPREQFSRIDTEDRMHDHEYPMNFVPSGRPQAISRKPVGSTAEPFEPSERQSLDLNSARAGGERRSRASLSMLRIPASRDPSPGLGHNGISPVSPVSPVSSLEQTESNSGQGRDISPRG